MGIVWGTDCRSLYDTLASPDSRLLKDKRYTRDVAGLKNDLRNAMLMIWVPTNQQLADALTKPKPGGDLYYVLTTASRPDTFDGAELLDSPPEVVNGEGTVEMDC